MTNSIYFIKCEVRKGTFYKVGFTKNLAVRILPYITHNPQVEFLEYLNIYSKTKRELETKIHKEVKEMGYHFKVINGIETEWFFVPMSEEKEFEQKGLKNFKVCNGRKIFKF